jgi:hypothetical protein
MSSGGGSSSDSGSTGGYDEAGISTPTSAYESIGTTGVMMKQEQQHHLMLLIL